MPDDVVATARRQAGSAAAASGIRLVEARTPDEMAQVRALFDEVWQADPTNPAVTAELLLAYAHTGQYVVLAHDCADDPAHDCSDDPAELASRLPVAASVGFLAAPVGRALHSNITGVRPAGLGRSIGWAVKLHQRAWALAAGLDLVTWTYDPLIRRNAWFNVAKLAARPVAYEVDFYGTMRDARNDGDESDRLYVRWPLDRPAVLAAAEGRTASVDVDALRGSGFRELVAVDAVSGGPRRSAGLDEATTARQRRRAARAGAAGHRGAAREATRPGAAVAAGGA